MPPKPAKAPAASVPVQQVQFASLQPQNMPALSGNIGLLMDVPLQVTVELGRTKKLIREILDLGPGSVVELDKLAGEPIDVYVNTKLIAKGEVVVIDENFGVRITEIVSPLELVNNLQ
jgi:flagellar motor switch protein FliN/FliY